ARFFNADGTARTGEVQINQTSAGRQDLPTLERLADGSLIAAWRSYDATGQSFAIMGRRFDAQGNALGAEFQLSDARYTQPAAGDFSQPSLSARLDGGFVAYWQDPTPGANAFVSKVFMANANAPGRYIGTAGADALYGSSNSDTLTGGAGADMFLFTDPNQGADTITDFQSGIDRIEVVGPSFGGLPTGQLNAGRFALNAPGDADDRFVFNTTSGALSYDPDGNGTMAATTIALLNVRSLSASDIWVVAPT
ncbi:hypothetical protein ACFSBS_18580, partial [Azospirillum griseum]